jgi:hypothetical protein
MNNDLCEIKANGSGGMHPSSLDWLLVERLRATVQTSLEWADGALDIFIELEELTQELEDLTKLHPEPRQTSGLEPGCGGRSMPGDEFSVRAATGVQRIRRAVRDATMSMQYQDVIGQAIERAACALEKRAAITDKLAQTGEQRVSELSEVAEIRIAYQVDDDLHRMQTDDNATRKAA